MAFAGFLFFVSGVLFIASLAAVFVSTFWLIVAGGSALFFAVGAWSALVLAAYNVVKSIEVINAPDWRGCAWLAARAGVLLSVAAWTWYFA